MLLRSYWFRQAALALGHAVCVLLGLSPFDIWPLSFVAVFFLLVAAKEQHGRPWRDLVLPGIFFALALACIPFGWIIFTIHRYTGENALLTGGLTILYALLFQIKVLFFFLISRVFFGQAKAVLSTGAAMAAAVALVDALSPELFVWCWGNTLAGEGHLRQWAAIGSVYGVSFIAAFGGWILFRLLVSENGEKIVTRFKRIVPEFLILGVLIVVGVLLRYFPDAANAAKLSTLVIQTNIGAAPEARRGDAAFATDAINRLFNQSAEGLLLHDDATLVVWPEAAMPFHSASRTAENAGLYSASLDGVLEYLARAGGVTVLYQDMAIESGKLRSRLTARPAPANSYFKRRLVPWGEYLPLEKLLPRMRKIFPDAGRFVAASEGNEFTLNLAESRARFPSSAELVADIAILGNPPEIERRYSSPEKPRKLTVKPLLCYEALFPADSRVGSAELIVNLSSDAWFGDGVEGWQHAGAAALRAVENGVPMLRAAMSGVSYVVDNRGDFIGRVTGQGRPETLYNEIPLVKRFTLFQKFGMGIFYLLMAAALLPYALKRFTALRTREDK